MGRKLYIKDDQGREFTNREWAFSDTKVLAGILTYDAYLKTLEAQFQLNFRELNQVQLSKHIQGPGDEHWSYTNSLLADIKELKRALRGTSNSNNAEFFEQLSHTAVEIVGTH